MNNSCFDTEDYKAPKGLQNISPCQYSELKSQEIKLLHRKVCLFKPNNSIYFQLWYKTGAPVYISNPHFYLADNKLLESVEGLMPNQSLHESYFKIQPVWKHLCSKYMCNRKIPKIDRFKFSNSTETRCTIGGKGSRSA